MSFVIFLLIMIGCLILLFPPLGAIIVVRVTIGLWPDMPRHHTERISAALVPLGYLAIVFLIFATPLAVDSNGPQIMGGLILVAILLIATPFAYLSGKWAIARYLDKRHP